MSTVTPPAASTNRLTTAIQELGILRHQLGVVAEQLSAEGAHSNRLLGDVATEVASGAGELEELAAVATDLDQRASHGDRMIADLIEDLGASASAMQSSIDAIERLVTIAAQIGGVAEAIDRIAAATRMLALNARIEAARAGTSGAGFAVVAGEVKDLAAQTASEANRIASMVHAIDDVATTARAAATAMGADADAFARRRERADGARAVFDEIATAVSAVTGRTSGLAAAGRRQTVQLAEARAAVDATSTSARVVERSAAALSAWSEQIAATGSAVAAETLAREHVAPELVTAADQLAGALAQLVEVPLQHVSHTLTIAERARAERGKVAREDLDQLDPTMSANLRRLGATACGVTVTIAPNALANARLHMHWWVHDAGGVHRHEAQLDPARRDFYDYSVADWFAQPRRQGSAWYSDPYFDEGGADRDVITVSVPFDGALAGVATVDLALEQVQRLLGPALDRVGRPVALVAGDGRPIATSGRVTGADHVAMAAAATAAAQVPGIVVHGDGWDVVAAPQLPWRLVVASVAATSAAAA